MPELAGVQAEELAEAVALLRPVDVGPLLGAEAALVRLLLISSVFVLSSLTLSHARILASSKHVSKLIFYHLSELFSSFFALFLAGSFKHEDAHLFPHAAPTTAAARSDNAISSGAAASKLWTIGWDQFIRETRHAACVQVVTQLHASMAGEFYCVDCGCFC